MKVNIPEIQARAERIWEQYKAEEISSEQFRSEIKALEAELPEGMSIRWA
ncbi:MAG TPA: hypothetical protein VFU47_15940 [Armatimonadota bacterium]|nr:hypothetical protein [Armatimonadota bacterium]